MKQMFNNRIVECVIIDNVNASLVALYFTVNKSLFRYQKKKSLDAGNIMDRKS